MLHTRVDGGSNVNFAEMAIGEAGWGSGGGQRGADGGAITSFDGRPLNIVYFVV